MNELWALIQSGYVVNMVWALTTDYQDPSYVWVDVTSLTPQPGVGWSYDGNSFSPPPPPPVNWSYVLELDVYNIHESYLQALNDYEAAVAAGSTSAAQTGISNGITDSMSTYTPNEASPFTTFVGLVQTGG